MKKHTQKSCPKCEGKDIAKYLWGMPAWSKKMEKDLEDKKVILGGCCVSENDPKWHCNACEYEWGADEGTALLDIIKKSQKQNVWNLGNSVLYELCKNHDLHKEDSEIIAKIWLIGRSYAAAIERRKNKDENLNDDFYISTVVPRIKESSIDSWIQKCRASDQLSDSVEAHKNLTDLFSEISGLEKRSLASKYLHFHLPDKFYIYDSRAVSAVNCFAKKFDIRKCSIAEKFEKYDSEYLKFVLKCNSIKTFVMNEYAVDLSCRDVDNLLIEIANEKLREQTKN